METMIIIKLSPEELRTILSEEIKKYFKRNPNSVSEQNNIQNNFLIAQEAADFLHIKLTTLYSKVSLFKYGT